MTKGVSHLRGLERNEAIDRALLYTFQLSNKNYAKMRAALSSEAFVLALEQDGWTVTGLDEMAVLRKKIESIMLGMSMWIEGASGTIVRNWVATLRAALAETPGEKPVPRPHKCQVCGFDFTQLVDSPI